jgi:ElaB/YqjD/DUF883 family membrane-anchored ribosome-binding protein
MQTEEFTMVHSLALSEKDDIGQHLDRLRADVATLSETVKRLASEGVASAQSQAGDAASRVTQGASAAGHQIYKDAASLGHDAANAASAASGQIEMQIARNPLTSVLVALGVGFAIGLSSRRQ